MAAPLSTIINSTLERFFLSRMPTVYRQDGFRIAFYSNEHPSPHVHVFRAEGELVFELGSESEEPWLDRVLSPMNPNDARRARAIVKEQHKYLLEEWRKRHGREEV